MSGGGRRERRTALLDAVASRDHDAIRSLCTEDPSLVDAPNAHHNTAIGLAVSDADAATVQLLLELGADPHQRNHGGGSLLDGAALASDPAVVEVLLAAGCDLTPRDAARLERVDDLARLLDADPGALVARHGRNGRTILHEAAATGAAGAVELLVARGADVDATDEPGFTPLSLVELAGRGRGVDAARVLLDAGADPDPPGGWHGGSLLIRAVMNRDVEPVALLLERGADPDRTDWSDESARSRAAGISKAMAALFADR